MQVDDEVAEHVPPDILRLAEHTARLAELRLRNDNYSCGPAMPAMAAPMASSLLRAHTERYASQLVGNATASRLVTELEEQLACGADSENRLVEMYVLTAAALGDTGGLSMEQLMALAKVNKRLNALVSLLRLRGTFGASAMGSAVIGRLSCHRGIGSS